MTDTTFRNEFSIQDAPSEEFIESVRSRFPTEDEVDRMLTEKLRNRRNGGPHQRVTLDDMRSHIETFLDNHLDDRFEVTGLRWFAGGVSKIQVGFELTWTDPKTAGVRSDRLVVRMDPAEGNNATSRMREHELLRLMKGTVPVPDVFWVDGSATWFPRPALVFGFADGVTKPSSTSSGAVSGIGTDFGPKYRELLAPQFMEHLARIHTLSVEDQTFQSLQLPTVGTRAASRWLVNQAQRTWEEDRGEDVLLMEVAANWLSRNQPKLDQVSVVHGDFRSGNFLFDEATGDITAWLDWERGHLGDRHRDLAWTTSHTFGHVGDDGQFYVCGLIPEDEFFAKYESLTGLSVDKERLDFYRILNDYAMVVSALASAYRVTRLGKSHQDILLSRLEGVVPQVLSELRALLKERA